MGARALTPAAATAVHALATTAVFMNLRRGTGSFSYCVTRISLESGSISVREICDAGGPEFRESSTAVAAVTRVYAKRVARKCEHTAKSGRFALFEDLAKAGRRAGRFCKGAGEITCC
jgi:hypothetical protein